MMESKNSRKLTAQFQLLMQPCVQSISTLLAIQYVYVESFETICWGHEGIYM